MNMKSLVAGLGVVLMLATGCSSGSHTVRVAVPPRVDLHAYPVVGLVSFSSNAKGQLDRVSTQRFMRAVQAAQPGTRVIELGSEQQVLASVDGHTWDRQTLRAVKEKHGVDVVVLGRFDVERAKPEVNVSTFVKTLSVKQDVNAELTARLVETDTGATMWSDGAKCTTTVSHAAFNNHGEGNFGATDADAAYGEMVDGLVYRVTDAFRTHYVNRRVSNDEAVARAE